MLGHTCFFVNNCSFCSYKNNTLWKHCFSWFFLAHGSPTCRAMVDQFRSYITHSPKCRLEKPLVWKKTRINCYLISTAKPIAFWWGSYLLLFSHVLKSGLSNEQEIFRRITIPILQWTVRSLPPFLRRCIREFSGNTSYEVHPFKKVGHSSSRDTAGRCIQLQNCSYTFGGTWPFNVCFVLIFLFASQ